MRNWNRLATFLPCYLCFILLSSCTSPTLRELWVIAAIIERVIEINQKGGKNISWSKINKDCKFLGKVKLTSISQKIAKSPQEAKNLMLDEAKTRGGDYLLVDAIRIHKVIDRKSSSYQYIGSGKIYKCL